MYMTEFKQHNINLNRVTVTEKASIILAVTAIDSGGIRMCVVVDAKGKFVGIVTDGDVRRGLLRGVSVDESVLRIVNRSPLTAIFGTDEKELDLMLEKAALDHVPLLDESGKFITIHMRSGYLSKLKPNTVVFIAGGLGTRLRPFTEFCSKPMLPISGKPILEIMLNELKKYGFRKFLVAVNYKKEDLYKHFGDGVGWGVRIEYIEEKRYLGTAGSLSLIPKDISSPILVINGDILANVDFEDLLHHHSNSGASLTICTWDTTVDIPYGVLETEGMFLQSINEKPQLKVSVNAGIYVLEPKLLASIPNGEFYDMPDLINEILINGKDKIAVYRKVFGWVDVGNIRKYLEALEVYGEKV
jgi:dTDP-glucose pyrophosphorylase